MANLNTSNFASAIKVLYEKQLLGRALPRLIHNMWGKQASWKGYGSYELRKYSSLSPISAPLGAEGVTPSEMDQPTLTTLTITPQLYGSWIGYTEQLELEQYDNVIGETYSLLGEQAGLTFDRLTRDALNAGASVIYAGTATTRGEVDTTNDLIGYDEFLEALATLEANNALPVEGGAYVCVMHPYSFAELMRDATFVTLFTREGGEVIRSGRMGKILNCVIYVTSEAKIYTGEGASSADVYSTLFIGMEAYGLAGFTGLIPKYNVAAGSGEHDNMTNKKFNPVSIITKGLGETGLDPLNQRGTIGWKASHEETIINSDYILSLEHAVAF